MNRARLAAAVGAAGAVLLMVGCATGLQRDALDARLAAGYPSVPAPGPRTMATPVKLAVLLQFERRHGAEFTPDARLGWSRHDKATLVEYLRDGERLKALSEFVFLPEATPADPASVAAAAQALGADAVLVLRAAMDVDWYCNPSVLLDPTLIGAIWVPSSHRDVLVAVRADLFDLRQAEDGPVWTATSDETRKITGATLVVDTRDAADPARRAAVRRVLERLYAYWRGQVPRG